MDSENQPLLNTNETVNTRTTTNNKRKSWTISGIMVAFCVVFVIVALTAVTSDGHSVGSKPYEPVVEGPALFSTFYPSENPYTSDSHVEDVSVQFSGKVGQGLILVESVPNLDHTYAILDFDVSPPYLKDLIKVEEEKTDNKYSLRIVTPSYLDDSGCLLVGLCDDFRQHNCDFRVKNGKCEKVLVKVSLKIPAKLSTFQIDSENVRIEKVNNEWDDQEFTRLQTQNGHIKYRNLKTATYALFTTLNGETNVTDVYAPSAEFSTQNGRASLERSIIDKELQVKTSNGYVHVDQVSAESCFLQTLNGKIFLGESKFKRLTTHNANGITIGHRVLATKSLAGSTTNGRITYDRLLLDEEDDDGNDIKIQQKKKKAKRESVSVELTSKIGSLSLSVEGFGGDFDLASNVGQVEVDGDNLVYENVGDGGMLGKHIVGRAKTISKKRQSISMKTQLGAVFFEAL